MKNKVLKIFNYLVFLTIGVVLLYLAFRGIDMEELWQDILTANYSWIILSVMAGFLAFISRGVRWFILIEGLNYTPKKSNVYHALMVGYLANMAIPRIGEITRCGALNRVEKIPVDKLLGTVILERALDLLMLIILMILVIFFKLDFFGKFISDTILIPFSEMLSNTFKNLAYFWMILVLVLTSMVFLTYRFRKKLMQNVLFKKAVDIFRGVAEGFKSLLHMKKAGWFVFHTLFIWFMYILMTYLVFFAIDETSVLTFIDSVFMIIFGGIGMTIPTPGGIGSYHELVRIGLSLFEISEKSSAAFSILTHESQAFLVIVLGGISVLILSLRRKNKTSGNESTNNN